MVTLDPLAPTDSAELQNVLTRYVDSVDGYRKAAQVVDQTDLAVAFEDISNRRSKLVERVSSLIENEGSKSDSSGSAEAVIHRWWMDVRARMTDEDLRVILDECLRGEKELQRTVRRALAHGELKPVHQDVIADMAVELDDAIHTFEAFLNP
jgi:uncharacterized protein (TIGR02284 family)